MATSKGNLLTHGMSGSIGQQIVFRNTKSGKIIVANRPTKRSENKTEAQSKHRQRFQLATIYSKNALKDENIKDDYKQSAKPGETAYNVAMADFLNAPEIDTIDISNYTGKVGDTIRIRATDDFKVERVEVDIVNGDGTEVEEGEAVADPNGIDWIFTAKVENTSTDGDKITIRVYDMPGNETDKTQDL